MKKVIVLGAGAMGLAAAYHAQKAGHDVTVLEAAPEVGGMAAHFDFGGLSIERYYHFVCKADQPTFDLLEELGIGDKMRWRDTSMGYWMGDKVHPWGDPVSLLAFKHLNLIEKVRYGLMMFVATRRNSPDPLENVSAKAWIEGWCGKSVYERLWRRLFDLKFYEYADNISAAWIWTRIKRVGNSRKSLMQEELGYIEGGTETLVKALEQRLTAAGTEIRLREPARRIVIEAGKVVGVETDKGLTEADAVISTVPTPYVGPLLADMPAEWRAQYEKIANIGVICLLLKLKRSVTKNFWVNVVDQTMGIPGFIEFSNLRPVSDTIVYVPYYMPTTNPLWRNPDDWFVKNGLGCLKRVNPALKDEDLIGSYVGRLSHAQPVCQPGFKATLPPVQTSVGGLQIADTCFYYPEDRGIAESVRYGKMMAEAAVA